MVKHRQFLAYGVSTFAEEFTGGMIWPLPVTGELQYNHYPKM
jgi:hypothetical protein